MLSIAGLPHLTLLSILFFKESNLDLPTVQDYSFSYSIIFSLLTHTYMHICVFVLLRILSDFVGFGVPYSVCLHGNVLVCSQLFNIRPFLITDKIQQAPQT